MENQELFMQANYLQQQAKELEENLNFIENQILELVEFSKNLSFISKTKEKSLLSALGRGVYAKTNLEDKKLFVEIGSNIIVKKTPEETKITIEEQVKRLSEAKHQVQAQLELVTDQITGLIKKLQIQEKE